MTFSGIIVGFIATARAILSSATLRTVEEAVVASRERHDQTMHMLVVCVQYSLTAAILGAVLLAFDLSNLSHGWFLNLLLVAGVAIWAGIEVISLYLCYESIKNLSYFLGAQKE